MTKSTQKICFVIAPIGSPESDIRKFSDKVLKFIIRNSLEPIGYQVIRADEISEPGTINIQVIKRLIDADIVVADLTGTNPNVMYELAIRHALKKPIILMIKNNDKLPFDIANERTIVFDINDIESVENAKIELVKQAKHIFTSDYKVETPFSLTEEVVIRASSGRPIDANIAKIAEDIAQIKNAIRTASIFETKLESFIDKSTIEEKWIRISLEYPNSTFVTRTSVLEISHKQSVLSVLNNIYFLLRNQKDAFHPKAFTYLWDWILVRKQDQMPLLMRGMLEIILATSIIKDGDVWQVVVLNKPILNKPERFGFHKGKPERH